MQPSTRVVHAALALLLVAVTGVEAVGSSHRTADRMATGSSVTPIEKVIQLLKDLEGKVEKEGAKEAAQYDAYSCFCKNQAKFKADAIAKSEEKIEVLKADISDLNAEINDLNEDITELGKDIKSLEEKIEKAEEIREKEHEVYLAKEKDVSECINSCEKAIEALKASKEEMTDAKLNLAQLKSFAATFHAAPSAEALKEALALVKQASKFSDETALQKKVSKPGEAAGYEYRSNDIIATIQELEKDFLGVKKDLDDDEFNAQGMFDKKTLGWTNSKNFKTKTKKEKEVSVEEKTEAKMEAEAEKKTETEDKESDEAFVKSLNEKCEAKANSWDQRSKARSAEMAALAEAVATLEKGVATTYAVNKKLVGLVAAKTKLTLASKGRKGHWVWVDDDSSKPGGKSPSFLQLRSAGHTQAAAVQRMLQKLDESAKRLNSPVLAAVSTKITLSEDHFVKVRGLIKDLISKLKADAKAEATQKGFCDTEMAKALNKRDKGSADIEEEEGIIASKTALSEAKTKEIADLSEEIAQLNKELVEANELRATEKLANEEAMKEAAAGSEAVQSALDVLEGFYSAALLEYKPPKSNRYGETVDDVAPEAFKSEDYNGAKSSAKGIIGILEVIKSDFDRTEDTVDKDEKKAVKDHADFVKTSEDDIDTKEKKKDGAEKAKDAADLAIVQAKDDLYDAKTMKANAESELLKLKPMCVEGEETYAERVAARNQEIAALKEAMTILDDWQK